VKLLVSCNQSRWSRSSQADEETAAEESELSSGRVAWVRRLTPGGGRYAIDHIKLRVLAYVFGRRKNQVFLDLKKLLELFELGNIVARDVGGVPTS